MVGWTVPEITIYDKLGPVLLIRPVGGEIVRERHDVVAIQICLENDSRQVTSFPRGIWRKHLMLSYASYEGEETVPKNATSVYL